MPTIDAKRELDDIFRGCADVLTFIGTAQLGTQSARLPLTIGIVRIVFAEDSEVRAWPKTLVYRCAMDVGSTVKMFTVFEPPNFTEPLVAQEWSPSCQNFMDAANGQGHYLIEIVLPSRVMRAFVVNDKVTETVEHVISPEEYANLKLAFIDTPPKSPVS